MRNRKKSKEAVRPASQSGIAPPPPGDDPPPLLLLEEDDDELLEELDPLPEELPEEDELALGSETTVSE